MIMMISWSSHRTFILFLPGVLGPDALAGPLPILSKRSLNCDCLSSSATRLPFFEVLLGIANKLEEEEGGEETLSSFLFLSFVV